MSAGTRRYGVSNLEYDLVTTLANLLQGEEHLTQYAQDAEQAGDHECAKAFRALHDNNRASAEQLHNALARLLSGQATGGRGQTGWARALHSPSLPHLGGKGGATAANRRISR